MKTTRSGKRPKKTAKTRKKLPRSFYTRKDVVEVARDLLGKKLVSKAGGVRTSGIITETEAYAGATDRACHAYGGRRTQRTEVMYHKGGTAYVYLCYGIHHLFNVVTNQKEHPDAVLIRALLPLEGIERIRERRGHEKPEKKLTEGPGTLTQALNIKTREHTGTDLLGKRIWIEDTGIEPDPDAVHTGPRVGIDYAGGDALLPYRFKVGWKELDVEDR